MRNLNSAVYDLQLSFSFVGITLVASLLGPAEAGGAFNSFLSS